MNYKRRKKLFEDVSYVKQQLQNGAAPKYQFDFVDKFYEGFALVFIKNKGWNFINTNGELISDWWFYYAYHFVNGFAKVRIMSRGWNFIKPDGNFLRDDMWFDNVDNFSEGFAAVELKGKGWNFIDADGNLLCNDLWFDDVEEFHNGFVKVYLDGKKCFLDTKGNLYDEDNNLINKVNENKRRVVRMTESQLRNTIKRVVAQCLNERRIR